MQEYMITPVYSNICSTAVARLLLTNCKNRNMNSHYLDVDSTMAAAIAFNNIVNLVQSSNLNFRLELSPFAANISLKKTPVKNKSGIPLLPCVPNPRSVNVEALVTKNLELENELFKMKNN